MSVPRPTCLAAACLAVALLPGAAGGGPPAGQGRSLRAGVDVVTVPAVVTDESGRLVTGLTSGDFVLFEDGIEQPITQFVGDRVPVSLGVVLDASQSMVGERLVDARLALERFVGDLLDPGDEAFLAVFNHRPRVVAPWTSPPAGLKGRLDGIVPSGGTAIYDAVLDALDRFDRRQHQRAALVLVSDGADTASDHDVKEVRSRLRRSDAFLYAIAIDAPAHGRERATARVDPFALRAMTDDSGGYTEVIKTSADLVDATARIATELNHQYVLGYVVPAHGADDAYHAIRLRARNPALRVRARKGYVATPHPARR